MPGLGNKRKPSGLGSGGTAYNPNQHVPPAPTPEDTYITPPPLSFDPSIEAQRRAAQRGLSDTEEDVKTKEHFANKDLSQALRDIRTSTQRKRGDINRETFRTSRGFDQKEGDLNKQGERANQDFDSQLANIGRQFAQLGHRQGEAANAAGVHPCGGRSGPGG
jgi:hypothetical protein